MALPDDNLTLFNGQPNFLVPDHIVKSPLIDYEIGGVAPQDNSQGNNSYEWKATYEEPEIRLSREPYCNYIVVLSEYDVTELSFTFDQNMRHIIAYIQNGLCKLHWFDIQINSYTTTSYPGAISPKVALDDKRDIATAYNDVLFFYLKDGNLCYRQQRDRFGIERVLAATNAPGIRRIGMTTGLRFAVELDAPPPPIQQVTAICNP
jgi:hypothetical protein